MESCDGICVSPGLPTSDLKSPRATKLIITDSRKEEITEKLCYNNQNILQF